MSPNGEENYVIKRFIHVASAMHLRKTIENTRKIRTRKKTKRCPESMVEYLDSERNHEDISYHWRAKIKISFLRPSQKNISSRDRPSMPFLGCRGNWGVDGEELKKVLELVWELGRRWVETFPFSFVSFLSVITGCLPH